MSLSLSIHIYIYIYIYTNSDPSKRRPGEGHPVRAHTRFERLEDSSRCFGSTKPIKGLNLPVQA